MRTRHPHAGTTRSISWLLPAAAAARAGVLFLVVGALGLAAAGGYPRGSLREMGPGYLPLLFAGVLCVLGVMLLLQGWRTPVAGSSRRFDSRPVLVLVAAAAFGWLMPSFGLLVATAALVVIASLGDREIALRQAALLAAALALVTAAVFVWALGLPLPLLPAAPGWW